MDGFIEQKVYVRPWGLHVINSEGLRLSVENIRRRSDFIIEQCLHNQITRVLIEAQRTQIEASTEEVAEGIQSIKRLENAGLQIAIVAPKIIESGKSVEIENMSAQKKVSVKYFQDKMTALKWLTADLGTNYSL